MRLNIALSLSACTICDAFTSQPPKQQQQLVSSSLQVSKTIPDLSSSTKPVDEASIFVDNEDSLTDNEDDTWQKNLDMLLAPDASVAERQIVLSDLLTSREEIQESVRTALRERKVSRHLYIIVEIPVSLSLTIFAHHTIPVSLSLTSHALCSGTYNNRLMAC